jgi:hypothetical protein
MSEMDAFVRTVGQRSQTKLYDKATTLISKGAGMRNVLQLKNVLTAMDLALEPLSKAKTKKNVNLKSIKNLKTFRYRKLPQG